MILPEVFSSKNCILVLIRLSTTLVWMFLLMLMKMRLLTYLPRTVTTRQTMMMMPRPLARPSCDPVIDSVSFGAEPGAGEALPSTLLSLKSLKAKAR